VPVHRPLINSHCSITSLQLTPVKCSSDGQGVLLIPVVNKTRAVRLWLHPKLAPQTGLRLVRRLLVAHPPWFRFYNHTAQCGLCNETRAHKR
jgi:hypothetical protein